MKELLVLFVFLLSNHASLWSQNDSEMPSAQDYFVSIPDYPSEASSINVLLRMIEGLGYRYHWASADLNDVDLSYRPSDDGKSTLETLDHIHDLSLTIIRALKSEPNIRPVEKPIMGYTEMRSSTLKNLMDSSLWIRSHSSSTIEDVSVIFQRGERISSFPFWNLINGQLSDALYHVGQIVAFRRASGNPINSKVNVFLGKNRE